MPQNPEENANRLQAISELIRDGQTDLVREKLQHYHAAEISHVLESLPRQHREQVWELLNPEIEGDVLTHVNDDVRKNLIRETDSSELITATQHLETDDLADIIPDLPDNVSEKLLASMDAQHRRRLETVMSYREDTAGGLMNTDTITVRGESSLDVVLRYLRLRGDIPDMTDNLIVVDRKDQYQGTLALTELLIRDPNLAVSDIASHEQSPINVHTAAHDVATLFELRDLISAAVVDDDNRLLGRITIDDVVDVIREEADHSLLSMAGLNEEHDMFAPVFVSSQRRSIWLGINLLTALLASWVIGQFEHTIEQLVALAVLMPLVASMGGVAGSQTLTLVIRGIALGQVSKGNTKRLLNKEILVGVLNGCLWAVVVAIVAMAWFHNYFLGVIIGAAMLMNLIVAAFAGATIPLLLNRFGIDPALAGGVVLTTVTDVVGFLVFLGMAAMFLV